TESRLPSEESSARMEDVSRFRITSRRYGSASARWNGESHYSRILLEGSESRRRDMSHRDDVLIIIRSKRPVVQTIESYPVPMGMHAVILSDPSVYAKHRQMYKPRTDITVIKGVEGLGAQSHRAYRVAYDEGYDWVFRMDDDLHDKFFIARGDPRQRFPSLSECIR